MDKLMHILNGPFVEALGWTLLHSLWQGALVMIILAVILGLTQGRNAHIRYGFATAALMLMLLWSGITFLSYYNQPLQEVPLYHTSEFTGVEGLIGPQVAWGEQVRPLEVSSMTVPYLGSRIEAFMHANSPLIAAFWLFGSLMFFLKWLGSLIYIHRIRRTAIMEVSRKWQNRLDNIAKRMGILKTIKLVESIRVHTPMVVGHFKPLILVPTGLLTGMSPEQVEAILIHELAHVRRNDYLINLAQSVLEIIYFYHPAYWWIADKIKQEREHCCDDIAVAVCGNAMLYARALTEVQARNYEGAPALALAATGKKNHLMNRVKRLLLPAQERANMAGKVILSFILLMSVWSFAWVEEIPQKEESEPVIAPIAAYMDVSVEIPSLEVPSVIVPNFEIPEIVLPEGVPAPAVVPETQEIFPIEVPEVFQFENPALAPNRIELTPQVGAFRFDFQFPNVATAFQQYFEFSFAVVDTPRPYIYRFEPLPEMPPVPALPRVDWEDEEARKTYEKALKLYEAERLRMQDEQVRMYEEALRMQEEYARLYDEDNNKALEVEKLQLELLLQKELADVAAQQASEAREWAKRAKSRYDNGEISEDELYDVKREATAVEKDAIRQRRKLELASIELKKQAESIDKLKKQGDLRELERTLYQLQQDQESARRKAEIARHQAELERELALKREYEEHQRQDQSVRREAQMAENRAQLERQLAIQREYQELQRIEAEKQRLAVAQNMHEAEKQMRMLEEQMRKQESVLRRQQEEMNKRVERMGRALKSELVKDGYIDSLDENLYINIKDDYLKVNGTKVKGRHYQKYIDIMEEHDLSLGKGSDFTIRF